MRVSEYFNLHRTQPSLDFVDVDVANDVPLFLDPRALRLLPSEWGSECVSLIQHFFRTVLTAINANDDQRAQSLLSVLGEPNETHLGFSAGRSRGRAVGTGLAVDVWDSLRKSEAVKTGLLEDLEDTILMVEGIAGDIVSDIATNLIREPLIHYTRDACNAYGIPMERDVDSGPVWHPTRAEWDSMYVDLPIVSGMKLLLVPKVIVRRQMDYDADEYYRNYILEFLQQQELEHNSSLVKLLKDGRRRVTFRSLQEKYGRGKRVIVRETLQHPDLLRRYRSDKSRRITPPLSHDAIAESSNTPAPDWAGIIAAVKAVPTGREHADAYEKAVEECLSALFYPSLANSHVQHEIHEGRKRIDITYTNVAEHGFFRWLAQHFAAAHVFVECKNYAGEVGNPELDQLAGRFSPSRGQFGLLVCRTLGNKELFLERCIDTAHDQRGFIVPLDDEDLEVLVTGRQHQDPQQGLAFKMLHKRFLCLVND